MIEGVIFDLGETLISFQGDWEETFRASRARLMRHLEPYVGSFDKQQFDDQFRRAIESAHQLREQDYRERPLAEILAEMLDELGLAPLSPEGMDRAMEVMFGPSEAAWNPVSGVTEVLDEIDGMDVRLGLVSNASDAPNVYRLMEKAAIEVYFDPIVVSAAHGWRKPSAKIFQSVLDRWQLPPEQAVMVGDTLGADIFGAQQMGLRNIWIRSSADRDDNRRLLERVQPEAIVDALDQVPAVIKTWQAQGS